MVPNRTLMNSCESDKDQPRRGLQGLMNLSWSFPKAGKTVFSQS